MRKITKQAVSALLSGNNYKGSNTTVKNGWLSLHGNEIAQLDLITGELRISNAGWFSNTTKERLNGLPNVSICQKKGVWYLNGNQWNGEWTLINR